MFKSLFALQLSEENQFMEIENLYNDGLGTSGSIQIDPSKQLCYNTGQPYFSTSAVPAGSRRQTLTHTHARARTRTQCTEMLVVVKFSPQATSEW